MTPKEQTRLQVMNSLLVEHMTLDQAATLMGVSPRHTRRILADYRKNGAASLAHGHRGRKPANAIPEATRSRVVHLARTVYEGANHTHLSELLSERVGLDMGRTTLRRILVNAGLSSPRRRRPPKHRVRRQRMPREGMLIQLDGSYHRWASRTAAWTSPGEKCSNSRSTWTNSRLPLRPVRDSSNRRSVANSSIPPQARARDNPTVGHPHVLVLRPCSSPSACRRWRRTGRPR